jgi:hypothetical protein
MECILCKERMQRGQVHLTKHALRDLRRESALFSCQHFFQQGMVDHLGGRQVVC